MYIQVLFFVITKAFDCYFIYTHDIAETVHFSAAELFVSISRHFTLELLTQFPASNDEKYLNLRKIDISNTELLSIYTKIYSHLVIFRNRIASKHKTSVKHLCNAGSTSLTLGQQWVLAIQMFCVYWDVPATQR